MELVVGLVVTEVAVELEELVVTEEVTVNLSKTVMAVHQELADKVVLVEEIMVI